MGILHQRMEAWNPCTLYIAILQLIQMSIDGGREFQLDLWDFYYAEDH